jgi:N-acetylmuramoyl-L-alanine amidase
VAPPESATAKASGLSDTTPPAKSGLPDTKTLTRVLGLKIGRIVIDPGHGGHDTGTIGRRGLSEKDLVLDVALRLRKLLVEKAGAEVVMTRSDDTFIPLEERTAIANEKDADLFVSIHANASHDPTARGVETYYLSFTSDPNALQVAARENATSEESVHQLQDLVKKIVLTEKIRESQVFAGDVQDAISGRLAKAGPEQRNRGVKRAPFVVLIGANMPSILAEISFLTNPYDERQLRKPEYRQKIAAALYQGIHQYMSKLGGIRIAEKASVATPPPPARAPGRPTGNLPDF